MDNKNEISFHPHNDGREATTNRRMCFSTSVFLGLGSLSLGFGVYMKWGVHRTEKQVLALINCVLAFSVGFALLLIGIIRLNSFFARKLRSSNYSATDSILDFDDFRTEFDTSSTLSGCDSTTNRSIVIWEHLPVIPRGNESVPPSPSHNISTSSKVCYFEDPVNVYGTLV